MTNIKVRHDTDQYTGNNTLVFSFCMIFSKSFGYALRGILYVAIMTEKKEKIQLDEIAEKLTVPRYFLGKIMNRLAKEGVLTSEKGPGGGFSINNKTRKTSLLELVKITGDSELFDSCVLRLRKCNSKNPCPLHHEIETLRNQWHRLLAETTVNDLLKKDQPDFIKSIATIS
ncbi:MAG: Rrf2 family transcriptional regulator [Chitinophagaceae bacterium]